MRTTTVLTEQTTSDFGHKSGRSVPVTVTDYPLADLTDTPRDAPVTVTERVTRKVSHQAFWGDGNFDKVNYSAEVSSSVTLRCEQDQEAVRLAQALAYELAWESVENALQPAVVAHEHAIRNVMFPQLFTEGFYRTNSAGPAPSEDNA